MLIYGKTECENLNSLDDMKKLINRGYTYMTGLPKGFVGFEETQNQQEYKDIYFEVKHEKTLLGFRKEEHDGKFVVQAFSCRNNLYIHYYLDYEAQIS